MESDTELQGTSATEGSFEVNDFSPSEPPEADISVVEDHGGPEPYQFELLAPATVMLEAGAEAVQSGCLQRGCNICGVAAALCFQYIQ